MIALDKKVDVVKTFGLDRISKLIITETKFKPIPYNVEKEFQHAFGVETYQPVQKIVLEFSCQQGNYIKSFPLHESQRIVEENEDKVLLEITIHPTNDIIMELLKYGSEVKVVSPVFLQKEMKKSISAMTKLYK